jgi:hypothetical protein
MNAQFDLFDQPVLDHEPQCRRTLIENDHPSLAPFWNWSARFEEGYIPSEHETWKFLAMLEQRIASCVQIAKTVRLSNLQQRSIEFADWYIVQAEKLLEFWDDLAVDSGRTRPEVKC